MRINKLNSMKKILFRFISLAIANFISKLSYIIIIIVKTNSFLGKKCREVFCKRDEVIFLLDGRTLINKDVTSLMITPNSPPAKKLKDSKELNSFVTNGSTIQ